MKDTDEEKMILINKLKEQQAKLWEEEEYIVGRFRYENLMILQNDEYKWVTESKRLMTRLVDINAISLEYANDELKGDREIVMAAARKNVYALQYASAGLKGDRDFILAAVQRNGNALEHASEELQSDRDVVLAAARENGVAVQFASDELKRDREILLASTDH